MIHDTKIKYKKDAEKLKIYRMILIKQLEL